MIRPTIFIIIFLGLHLFLSVFAVGQGLPFRYLREPAVKWNNERLTGEVKNAPVIDLIKEILQKTGTKGTNWEVNGSLKGNISMSFDNLTIDESVKKIMRQNRFNYTLISDERQFRDTNSIPRIKELAIYQEDQTIKFSRTSKPIPSSTVMRFQRTRKPVTSKPAETLPAPPPPAKSKTRSTQRSEPSDKDIAVIEKEMRAIADDMLAKKEITIEEYNALLEEIEAEKDN